eukprot:FR735806.1.p1 GENE.FR735806.1~~FR735806.1.p1  ORF type:complete len:244 (+),score=23.71 FR735806.1:91-732(+)
MEQNDLNPDYLDTPNKVLPGQPGVRDEQTTVRHFSPGLRYCLDTAEITNENRLFRGSYETTYVVPSLGLKAVCMSCARRCHLLRNVSTNFRRFRPGDTCGCAQTIHCICQCSPRRLIFDSLADDNGCRPKRGIDLETLEFDKLAELLTIIREEKGGITEEDLENATGVLMSDLGGPTQFNWFQFDKWYTANYENELPLEADGEAFMKQMKDPN